MVFKSLGSWKQANKPFSPKLSAEKLSTEKLSTEKQCTVLSETRNFKNRDCRLLSAIALSSLTTTLLIALAQLGIFQTSEIKTFDLLTRLTADYTSHDNPAANRVVIVAITEADIQAQNQWPLSDQVFAQVLAQLQPHRPEVIGLDIYRDVPYEPGSEALAQQLKQKNVIAINKLDPYGAVEVPAPSRVPASRIGFNDIVIDPDGSVRRNFMFAVSSGQQLYSFSLRLVEHYLATRGIDIQPEADAIRAGATQFEGILANAGGYQSIDASGYQTLVRYFPPNKIAKQLSLDQVLSGQFDPSDITGKVVLIGTTAPSQKDLFYTPFSSGAKENLVATGVVLHAQMTRQMLSAVLDQRPLFRVWSQKQEYVWVWLWGLAGGLLAWRLNHSGSIAMTIAIGLIGLSAITGVLFVQALWVPFVLPAFTFSLAGASLVVYKEFRKTFYDSITGLPNRTLLTQELQKLLKQQPGQAVTVILLDIDKFKVFNESFGLQIGDRLLQIMAARLQQSLPPKAKVARIAGDEFVVWMSQKVESKNGKRAVKEESEKKSEKKSRENSLKNAISIAQTLSHQMSEPIEIQGQKIFPTVSTGLAFSPAELSEKYSKRQSRRRSKQHSIKPVVSQPFSAESLIRDAQTALSRAKASHSRGQCEIFAPDMRTQISNRLWLESDLRDALAKRELLLYYQPLICLKTMTIAGFEALIRWQHPVRGMISPIEFIPIAEETGLIIPIGQWVLEVACQQAHQWQQQFPSRAPFMSVNLSGRQFSQADLVEQIDRILTETGLEPSTLKLELTESVVMDNVEESIEILLRLKALQLKLGIDDFGTGYSSLSYLHRFPIDTLKVDRSFVMEMTSASGSAELVKSIIALGHNLGMNVVAEGVETESQSQRLQDLQCEYGQGYLFSRPLPAVAAEALLVTTLKRKL
ncbi:MAG: EAL domain-containing protein [Phormidesmis sp.]